MEGSTPFAGAAGAHRGLWHEERARRAAYSLLRERPGASAGNPAGVPAALWLGPAGFLAILALVDTGVAALTIALLAGSAFLALAGLRLAAAGLAPQYAPRTPLSVRDLPRITVIAALHREAGSVAALVRALARFDYPADRYEIALAIEADDHETLAAAHRAARHALPALRVIAVPAIGPRTKPKALNYALALTNGSLVAVYDAEDEPHPGQLRAAAEAFAADAGLGCVQAPLGWPLPLGGTSNVFARAALADCGGWDPYNVTEDADLGFRLARYGWRAGLIAPGTLEEAPVTLKAWTAQRSRWLKGHAISWAVHMREPGALRREAGWRGLGALNASLGANAASALLHGPAFAVLAALIVLALANASPPWAVLPALAGYGAAILAARTGARRAGFRARAADLALLPAYWLLQSAAMARALREIVSAPYFWAKTEHGLTARARTAPDEPHPHACLDGGDRAGVRVLRLAQRQAG
ncbi:MAG: glycosyltransferase [Glycocaulis sp.]